jgi:acyl carrier protein
MELGEIMTVAQDGQLLEELRAVIAEVLEVEPEELTDTGDFADEYEADSLRAIEILARIDIGYEVEIPQAELPEMRNLLAVHAAFLRHSSSRV